MPLGYNDNMKIEGATDGTEIGNVSDALKVSAVISSSSANGTFLSSKYFCYFTTTAVSITSTVTYNTIYSYTGSGFFTGCNLEFNNTTVIPKITIDGNIVLDGFTLADYNTFLVTGNSVTRYQNGQGIVSTGSTLDFSTILPIKYTTSLVISARLSSATTRRFSQGAVYHSKDT